MIPIAVPPSKSLTQRALVLAALSDRECRVFDPLDCDDSRAIMSGLASMGVTFDATREGSWVVSPPTAFTVPDQPLVLGNAGTAVRFLTGLAPLVPGPLVIDGNDAMRRRPMPGLLGALRSLGLAVDELGRPGCPPIRLKPAPTAPDRVPTSVELEAGGSSQELSSLLLLGSRWPGGLRVDVKGRLPSKPYVDLTLEALSAFGVAVDRPSEDVFQIPHGPPRRAEYRVEPDWSSASYVLAASWLTGREVSIPGLSRDSAQGDRRIREIVAELDEPGPRRYDLADAPDIVPTVVACALFAAGTTQLRGVAHLRIKESDRIGVLVRELEKLGARLRELPDGIELEPVPLSGPATLDPSGDHRMAMAFGLVSLRIDGLNILDPGCVSKSYPGFWRMLETFQ